MAKTKANTAAQHTPGPWAFTEGDAERRASSTVYKANDKEFRIADVTCEWANPHQRAEDVANARLIASSPELLAALREIIAAFDYLDSAGVWEAIEKARAVVAKAGV